MTNSQSAGLPERVKEIESLVESNIADALKKMVDIYPEVSDSYYHELADSINIYILTKGDNRTRKYIIAKLKSIEDEGVKKIFLEWIDKL